MVDLGTLTYELMVENGHIRTTIQDAKPLFENSQIVGYKYVGSCTNIVNDTYGYYNDSNGATRLTFKDTRYTTVAALKEYLSGRLFLYELATPIVTDISDLLPEGFENIRVEAGGTITFEQTNDIKLPVPSTVKYTIER